MSNHEQEAITIENCFEPFIGQCFLSEEEAFKFYENYAKRSGFSIRKGRFVNKNGIMHRSDFLFHGVFVVLCMEFCWSFVSW